MPSASSKPNGFCAGSSPEDIATLLRTLAFASEVRWVSLGSPADAAASTSFVRDTRPACAHGKLTALRLILSSPEQKHAFQARKDPARTPYINHPSACPLRRLRCFEGARS